MDGRHPQNLTVLGTWLLCWWVTITVVWGSFRNSSSMKTHSWTPKSCSTDAVTAIMLHASPILFGEGLLAEEGCIMIKDHHFRKLYTVSYNFIIYRYFDRYRPHWSNKSYPTGRVCKPKINISKSAHKLLSCVGVQVCLIKVILGWQQIHPSLLLVKTH